MALGARPGRVEAMMVGQSALVAFGGLMFGLGGVMVAGRLIESLLYDVHPRDPAVIAGTAFIVFLASLLACWPAARRASRISPTDALRSD
jgi:ABC-type antimicrobial peptide transport system permease subunit